MTKEDQLKQDRELLEDYVNDSVFYHESSMGIIEAVNADRVKRLLKAQERVTREEERVAERMRCVEQISGLILGTDSIVGVGFLERAQKLILNQDNE